MAEILILCALVGLGLGYLVVLVGFWFTGRRFRH